ncbi:helix-turn-helix domain-containing protein [[Mycobacterium] wendilense]|uniref:Helix-turn-helix domain-containing protein n=1 Tax=[Mycobacterium] wendilense TaxID=3064284 RepID=A0ABM9MBR5_9MYCO|nr:helix-turn-helix domain-containing protein [Mycolicibacterium sp. MU0050]CAJ1581321.1 helix-turn-helix domain-containing protein [Mycolicibacterium sp. MU0050]
MSTRVAQAVDRALDTRHREATDDVERILAAAITVMQRVAPEAPRVSDIVTEAGSSKKAFYRYFAGKDDLLLAVMERGIGVVVSYLSHQMDKADRPADKVARWITGALAQVSDPHLTSMSRAVVEQMTSPAATDSVTGIMAPMRDMLIAPIAALGSDDPGRDAEAIFQLTIATMRRYVGSGTHPEPDDVTHLVRFCLRGLDAVGEDNP